MSELVLIANAGDSTITSFRLDADRLLPLATTQLPGSCSTFAVDADGQLLYAGAKGEPPQIITYDLTPTTGALTPKHQFAIPDSLAYLELTPDGRHLLAASYHGGWGAVWPVRDGLLGDATSTIAYANVHCVKASADGSRAYFVSLGNDLIAQYALSDAGVLLPLDPPTVAAPPGSGPRHLVFSPDESSGYLVTEFSGEVIRLHRDHLGRLTPAEALSAVDPDAHLAHSRYGADPRAEHLIWGADVHRAGQHVLATERTASTIASIALDNTGRLARVEAIRPTEPQPRGFAVSSDGTRVVVVGELGSDAVLYAMDDAGQLAELDRVHTGKGANWVRFVA